MDVPSNCRTVTIEPADAGERLDRVLAARLPDLSRARVQALIRAGAVVTDPHGAGRVDPSERVKAGAAYRVTVPEPEPAAPLPEAIPLAIVFEDAHLIVIDKAAGMVVHPAPGARTGTLVNALIAHCGSSLSGIGGVRRPGIVHRLDKDTSGLLVVAKTDAAHQGLSALFAAHGADGRLERRYTALVWGVVERMAGRIEAPLGRSPSNRTRMAVVQGPGSRRAVTHFEVLARRGSATEVALVLETGRTHQIRVHMAHIGHPVLGDPVYGTGFAASARKLPEAARTALTVLGRQALHAAVLGFEHPVGGRRLRFESAVPADMARLRTALGKG